MGNMKILSQKFEIGDIDLEKLGTFRKTRKSFGEIYRRYLLHVLD
jgi:hypothetical protein